jgi:hypothetical protein
VRAWDPVLGLVVGSYQGCSEALHGLAREAAKAKATAKWRQMGVRSVHEALGIYTHDVHRRWGSVFWWSWARVIRGRLPVIGRPNADILHHDPPPTYAHGREAVWRGREAWPQVHPGVVPSCAGHARRQACERRVAGWRVPAEPTMLRQNSHVLGF